MWLCVDVVGMDAAAVRSGNTTKGRKEKQRQEKRVIMAASARGVTLVH